MAILGTAYRVVYESKAFASGHTPVAWVLKPDKSVAGQFTLVELTAPFLGRYYFDYISQTTDAEGEYIVSIICASEGVQTTYRLSLYKDPGTTINLSADQITRAANLIAVSTI